MGTITNRLKLAKHSTSSPSNRLDYITNRLNLAKTSMSSLSNRLYLANPCCFREFNRLSNKNNRLFWGIHSIGKYKQSIGLSFLPFYLTTFNRLFCDNLKSNRLSFEKPEIQSIVLLIQSIDFQINTISQPWRISRIKYKLLIDWNC